MQVLHSLVVLVSLLASFLQCTDALPSPDFGVNATINPARSEVLSEALRLLAAFNEVSDVSVTLSSGTTILTQMQTAIVSVGRKVQSSGVTLTQRLQTLATSNGPSIPGAFNPVYEAIEALNNLTTNGLNTEMMSIRAVVPSYVTQKFNEVFGDLRRALGQLSGRLQTLERDVRNARTAAGNGNPITSTHVRNNVSAKTQSDVTKALVELRLKVTEVRYMVWTMLFYLKDADSFLQDIVRQVNGFGNALSFSLYQFSEGMNRLKLTVVQYSRSAFGCSLAEQNATLVQIVPALSAIANFSSTLQQPLANLLTALTSPSLSSRVNSFVLGFDSYISGRVAASNLMRQFLLSQTCQLVRKVLLTLISFGPQNEFCFNRFSSRVFGIYELHHNCVSKCYEAELDRFTTVAQFLQHAVDVLLYDVEDLADNLSVCVNLLEGRTTCIEQYGMLYTAVLREFTKMLNDTEKLYGEEFAASAKRLDACLSSSQYTTLNAIRMNEQRLEACQQYTT
uniref:Secreted protein n=1 Tax=Anopheles culicifacies TaxID=139723 RepID=A0A182M9K4_9DIPT